MEERKPAQPRTRAATKTGGVPPRAEQTPSPPPPAGGRRNEQWALDPGDVRRHAKRLNERKRVGPLGKLMRYTTVVLLLAGAVAVYWNFDTLRGTTVDLSSLTDLFARPATDGGVTGPGGVATQTEVVKETEVVGTAAPSSLSSAPPVAEAPAAPEPTTPAQPATESPPAASPREEPTPSTEPPPAAAPEPPPGPEQFSFGLDRMEVSEAAASADLLILRSGDMRRPSTVTWWTTDGTATAGQDYANLGRVVVKFAPNEQNRGIHIPIIGDRKVEGPESFSVNLAPGSDPTGEPTERLQVVINDDD